MIEKFGFKKAGVKRDWIHSAAAYKNELFYQYFNEEH